MCRDAALGDGAVSSGTFSYYVGSAPTVANTAGGGGGPTFPLTVAVGVLGVGTALQVNGGVIQAGFVQLNGAGDVRQPIIVLSGVTPSQAFTVQLCSVVFGLPTNCTTPDDSTTTLSSDLGVIYFAPFIHFSGSVDLVQVANSANSNEAHTAVTGGQYEIRDLDVPVPGQP